MSHASAEDRAKIEFPREFSGAWLHILSGLVTCRANIPRWDDNFERAKKLLATGMSKIILGISSDNLLDHASVQPLEVVSLVALQLLQDQVGKSGDISETYSLFLNSLVRYTHYTDDEDSANINRIRISRRNQSTGQTNTS